MSYKPTFVRGHNNYDPAVVSDACAISEFDVSKTVQADAEDADINVIVRRFGLTGQMPQNVRAPQYGDFDGITDYHSAMNAISAANSAFNQMPADVRARFQNDPALFVDFCSDPANLSALREMGLAVSTEVRGDGNVNGSGKSGAAPAGQASASAPGAGGNGVAAGGGGSPGQGPSGAAGQGGQVAQ